MHDGRPNTDNAGSCVSDRTIGGTPMKRNGRRSYHDRMDDLTLNLDATGRLISALFEQAPEPMLLVDVSHRVRDANDAARALLGIGESHFAGEPLRTVLPPGVDAEQVHRALAGLTQTPADFTWFETTGEVKHMTIEVRRLAPDGSLVVFRDMTARRKLEERLRETKRMESFGYMAGGIAHDLNNLLLPILCYSGLLQAGATEDPSPAMIAEIRQAAERASLLTRRLLSLLREPKSSPTSVVTLNAVVEDIATLLGAVVGDQVELVTQLDPRVAPTRVDRDRLERLILNLAVNARDAMPHGGKLILETSNVNLGDSSINAPVVAKPGPHVVLAVTDTGIGMDDDTRQRLFEPFFTTKDAGQGTGLGLSSAIPFLRQSHGWIFVESEPGMGTSFRIYLPAAEG
jgi:two-component system, cell cycle sensor histidine kinase and response regulator CckA